MIFNHCVYFDVFVVPEILWNCSRLVSDFSQQMENATLMRWVIHGHSSTTRCGSGMEFFQSGFESQYKIFWNCVLNLILTLLTWFQVHYYLVALKRWCYAPLRDDKAIACNNDFEVNKFKEMTLRGNELFNGCKSTAA